MADRSPKKKVAAKPKKPAAHSKYSEMVGPLWYHRKISQVDTKLAGKQKTICSN
jgi:hypothetical protein